MSNIPLPVTESSEPSLSGLVNDAEWLALVRARGFFIPEDDTSMPPPATPDRPEPLTSIRLSPTPRRISDYALGKVPAGNMEVDRATANALAEPHPEYTRDWYTTGGHLELIQKNFREPIFTAVAPTEQISIGQDTRMIDVFNFGHALSPERQEDLRRFVDIVTQFMGDRAYDYISDIVIGDFSEATKNTNGNKETAAFAFPGHGLVIVNTAILRDDAPTDETANGSLFLQTLLHEFGGHLLHGDVHRDPKALKDLERFAAAAGWNIEKMRKDGHNWLAKGADNSPYAPHYARPRAILMPPGGSPTPYGKKNPKETVGETSKHMMIGSKVMDIMPETSGAWMEFLQTRLLKPGEVMGDRPIATPLKREPITMTRRTGTDIRYPWVE